MEDELQHLRQKCTAYESVLSELSVQVGDVAIRPLRYDDDAGADPAVGDARTTLARVAALRKQRDEVVSDAHQGLQDVSASLSALLAILSEPRDPAASPPLPPPTVARDWDSVLFTLEQVVGRVTTLMDTGSLDRPPSPTDSVAAETPVPVTPLFWRQYASVRRSLGVPAAGRRIHFVYLPAQVRPTLSPPPTLPPTCHVYAACCSWNCEQVDEALKEEAQHNQGAEATTSPALDRVLQAVTFYTTQRRDAGKQEQLLSKQLQELIAEQAHRVQALTQLLEPSTMGTWVSAGESGAAPACITNLPITLPGALDRLQAAIQAKSSITEQQDTDLRLMAAGLQDICNACSSCGPDGQAISPPPALDPTSDGEGSMQTWVQSVLARCQQSIAGLTAQYNHAGSGWVAGSTSDGLAAEHDRDVAQSFQAKCHALVAEICSQVDPDPADSVPKDQTMLVLLQDKVSDTLDELQSLKQASRATVEKLQTHGTIMSKLLCALGDDASSDSEPPVAGVSGDISLAVQLQAAPDDLVMQLKRLSQRIQILASVQSDSHSVPVPGPCKTFPVGLQFPVHASETEESATLQSVAIMPKELMDPMHRFLCQLLTVPEPPQDAQVTAEVLADIL
eukprot:gene11835-2156_t